MPFINIKGINKHLLLKSMWENTKPAYFFVLNPDIPHPSWDNDTATIALKNGYIDYFQGRAIKTNLNKDSIDTFLYNQHAGDNTIGRIKQNNNYNTLEQIIEKLRIDMNTPINIEPVVYLKYKGFL
jgi:hypothetical protein